MSKKVIRKPGVAAANRARWANVSPEARSRKMSRLVSKRHKNSTPEQRAAIGRALVEARRNKQKKVEV